MYKLNLIAIVGIIAGVSFVVGMATPVVAFAQENMTMTMDENMSSMGNMSGGNATMTMDDNMIMSDMSNATSLTGQ